MELVQEIGSYAGIAAVVGLAVVSALYFSQARDVKRLREWAGRAPERTTPAVPAAPRVVAKPQAKPGAPAAKPAPAAAKAAGATLGAAPATAKAATPAVTKVGPAAATPAGAGRPAPPAPPEADEDGAAPEGEESEEKEAVPTAEAAATAAGATAAADATAAESEVAAQAEESAEPPVPAPVTAAANGPQGPPKIPAPPPRVPSSPTAKRPTIPPRPPKRAGRSQTMVLPPPRAADQSRFRRLLASPRYLVLVLAGVLVLGGAAAFGVTQLSGDDGGTTAPKGDAGKQDSGGGKKPKKGAPVDPASVTVSVLNGTTVPGLAAQIGDRLEGRGFKLGNITNSTDQARNESVVLFAPGHEREAKEVARRLRIPQREPIDPESQNLAGDATVVVVAGADQTQ